MYYVNSPELELEELNGKPAWWRLSSVMGVLTTKEQVEVGLNSNGLSFFTKCEGRRHMCTVHIYTYHTVQFRFLGQIFWCVIFALF